MDFDPDAVKVTFCRKNVYFRGIQEKLIKHGTCKNFGIKQCIGRDRNDIRITLTKPGFSAKPKRFCRLTIPGMIRAGTI